jgi:hypothetical protein
VGGWGGGCVCVFRPVLTRYITMVYYNISLCRYSDNVSRFITKERPIMIYCGRIICLKKHLVSIQNIDIYFIAHDAFLV